MKGNFHVPFLGEGDDSNAVPLTRRAAKDTQRSFVEVAQVFQREPEQFPTFAPVDPADVLHFRDIHAAGKTLCGADAEHVSFASWFWCATCERPASACPATFCPECRARFVRCLEDEDGDKTQDCL